MDITCSECGYPMTPRRFWYDEGDSNAPVYDWDCPTCGAHWHREPGDVEIAFEHLANAVSVAADRILALTPLLDEIANIKQQERERSRKDLREKQHWIRNHRK